MLPKVQNCLEAIEAGVRAVQIVDGTADNAALLGGTSRGTLIVAE